ncbi:MAG: cell division protein FtsA [Gammaproteobacteria bacterium]|nr:cell division protein FtsA [Gammaproteobacteria bacterium]MCY4200235.1 cell division protein FtsA [Gammaproteobacteria bacterium]MCY4277800.1 cell division protein FtsA [Gammaproteobacteria bacterium]MCY4322884.1 cell division protein FtsA [Gammaproteobacteria bacterium]
MTVITSLDIGTHKIVAIMGRMRADAEVEIIGVGHHDSTGLKRGEVVDIDATVDAIRSAIRGVEYASGIDSGSVSGVTVGIAGSHIRCMHADGKVKIAGKEVSANDIASAIDTASAIDIGLGERMLHVLPRTFTVDRATGVTQPIGMYGKQLGVGVLLVNCADAAASNIEKCVYSCEMKVDALVLEQIASSRAVLDNDEKALGVCVVDIGGGTTDIAVYLDGALEYVGVIPIAGDQMTRDIAHALQTPLRVAQDIKERYGCAYASDVGGHERVYVEGVGGRIGREIPRQSLADVVQARYTELFVLIREQLAAEGLLGSLSAGLVLTGGSASMEGCVKLAEEHFQMAVRRGIPTQKYGVRAMMQDPKYSTGVGLLLHRADAIRAARAQAQVQNRFFARIARLFGSGARKTAVVSGY